MPLNGKETVERNLTVAATTVISYSALIDADNSEAVMLRKVLEVLQVERG